MEGALEIWHQARGVSKLSHEWKEFSKFSALRAISGQNEPEFVYFCVDFKEGTIKMFDLWIEGDKISHVVPCCEWKGVSFSKNCELKGVWGSSLTCPFFSGSSAPREYAHGFLLIRSIFYLQQWTGWIGEVSSRCQHLNTSIWSHNIHLFLFNSQLANISNTSLVMVTYWWGCFIIFGLLWVPYDLHEIFAISFQYH